MSRIRQEIPAPSAPGFTLIEVLVALAVSAILLIGIASISQISLKQQTQSNVTFQADTLRRLLMSMLNNSAAWSNTIAANPSTLSCLQAGGTCSNQQSGGSITYVRDANNQPFYDWNGTDGLSAQGTPCNGFSSAPGGGNDACPLRFQITWQAICDTNVASCPWNQTQPMITIVPQYNPATQSKVIAFNPANYSARFIQGGNSTQCGFTASGLNLVENCATDVGVGTVTPQTALDVNGGIRPGSSGVLTGGSCGPEGTWGYDMNAHAPVFCNQYGKWAGAFGGNPTLTSCLSGNTGGGSHYYGCTPQCPPGTSLQSTILIAGYWTWYNVGLCY